MVQQLTQFQEYYKKHRSEILENSFNKFKEYYPELNKQDAKKEFEKQITEMFFLGR